MHLLNVSAYCFNIAVSLWHCYYILASCLSHCGESVEIFTKYRF